MYFLLVAVTRELGKHHLTRDSGDPKRKKREGRPARTGSRAGQPAAKQHCVYGKKVKNIKVITSKNRQYYSIMYKFGWPLHCTTALLPARTTRRGLARTGLARVLRILAAPDESSFPSTTFSLLSPTSSSSPQLHLSFREFILPSSEPPPFTMFRNALRQSSRSVAAVSATGRVASVSSVLDQPSSSPHRHLDLDSHLEFELDWSSDPFQPLRPLHEDGLDTLFFQDLVVNKFFPSL